MSLIDADRLKDTLVKHFDAYFNDKGQLMYSDHICTSDDVDDLLNLIDEQPTAYDVDKVVEQLESESARWQDSGDAYNDEKEKGVAIGFRKAIKIVKGGEIDGN